MKKNQKCGNFSSDIKKTQKFKPMHIWKEKHNLIYLWNFSFQALKKKKKKKQN